VRALLDDKARDVKTAGPSSPVEVLGLSGTPLAGDDFQVVENEGRAREVTAFRQRRTRDARVAAGARGTLEQMFSKIAEGSAKELGIVVKTDVQGSLEAITGAVGKIGTNEVTVRLLHGAVGGITEGDVVLAKASNGLIVGFNVRANPQAREHARRDGVEICRVRKEMKQRIRRQRQPELGLEFANLHAPFVSEVAMPGSVATKALCCTGQT